MSFILAYRVRLGYFCVSIIGNCCYYLEFFMIGEYKKERVFFLDGYLFILINKGLMKLVFLKFVFEI